MRALEAMEHGDAQEPPPEGADQGRWLCWEHVGGELCAGHLPALGRKGRNSTPLAPLHSLALLPGEHVIQVLHHTSQISRLSYHAEGQTRAKYLVGGVMSPYTSTHHHTSRWQHVVSPVPLRNGLYYCMLVSLEWCRAHFACSDPCKLCARVLLQCASRGKQ